AGSMPSAGVSLTPPSSCCLRPATRTMKNSSRFEATMVKNFSRSNSGSCASQASSSTRRLKLSHDSSRLMNSFGSASGSTRELWRRRVRCASGSRCARSARRAAAGGTPAAFDQRARLARPTPSQDLRVLVLESSDREKELLDFLAHALRQIGHLANRIAARRLERHHQHAVVALPPGPPFAILLQLDQRNR